MATATDDGAWLPAILSESLLASRVRRWTAAYAISRWLTRPTLGTPTRTPSDFGLCWEPLECRTDDGIRLAGWVVAPPMPIATVAIFHPVRRQRSHMLERLADLVAAGSRCVAFDHRAHGESSGRRTSFGYHESRDVLAVMNLVRQRWPVQPYLALGVGMGAAAICFAGWRLKGLSAIVLEDFCPDVQRTLLAQLGRAVPLWKWQVIHAVIALTERRLGVRLAQLAPGQHLRELAPTPLLMLETNSGMGRVIDFFDQSVGRRRGIRC
jgi:pimeloyl-ACP methyl ester carboxylesterase